MVSWHFCCSRSILYATKSVCYGLFWLSILLIIAEFTFVSVTRADELSDFARECDAAIGVTVENFDCDHELASAVDPTNFNGASCDAPNQLNKECDPGSQFRVLVNQPNAFVVAHCRKKNSGADFYGDIAVIQHNKKNGATCFYQALGRLYRKVRAPSEGAVNWRDDGEGKWKTPSEAEQDKCVSCHDNGPIIRSPYLNKLTGANALPGVYLPNGDFDTGFNGKGLPYAFVGSAFKHWKAFTVEVPGNVCTSCHRMGISNVASESGTSLDFGIRATSDKNQNKNPTSANSPIWMMPVPKQIAFSQFHADQALAIRQCALQFNENSLPNSPTCKIELFAKAFDQSVVPPTVASFNQAALTAILTEYLREAGTGTIVGEPGTITAPSVSGLPTNGVNDSSLSAIITYSAN